jgi:hypothetical protein
MNTESLIQIIDTVWRSYKMYKQSSSLAKGICIGAAAGMAIAALGTSYAMNNKKMLRKKANKALCGASSIMESIESMLK